MRLACSWDRTISGRVRVYVQSESLAVCIRKQLWLIEGCKQLTTASEETQNQAQSSGAKVNDQNCNARLVQKILPQPWRDTDISVCIVDPRQSGDRGVVDTAATHHCAFCEGTVTLYLYPIDQSLGEVGPKERAQIICCNI